MKKLMKGFTMIELLIVIAVLGILAVAVLSAINPIEQINRGKDTGSRSDAEQLLSAMDRYYATAGFYPWALDADSTNTAVTPLTEITVAAQTFGADTQQVLTRLSAAGTGEIKASFVTRIVGSAKHLWLYNNGTQGDSTYVCFIPASSSFREEAWKRCTVTLPTDFPAAACPTTVCNAEATSGTATGCYICLP